MPHTYRNVWAALILITTLLLLTTGRPVHAAPELTIGDYQLVSSKRITRTVFEYTYKATVTNNTGIDVTDVSATVSINVPGVTVLTDRLDFGDVPNGASSVSNNTFSISHDRSYTFSPNTLVWNVQYQFANLPPNPGGLGLLTLEGIDSDGDGVRDDVQIAIALKYPPDTTPDDNAKSAITQFARTLQLGFIKQAESGAQPLDEIFAGIIKATDCISHFSSTPELDVKLIEVFMQNTEERARAYQEINTAATGYFFGGEFNPDIDCQQ